MKRTSKIFAVVLAVMVASLFSSCALLDKLRDYAAPQGKWMLYPAEYQMDNGNGGKQTIYLDCYLMYSDESYANSKIINLRDENNGVIKTIPAGLSVVVVPSVSKKNASELVKTFFNMAQENGDPFIYMHVDKDAKAEINTESDEVNPNPISNSFLINEWSWALINACVSMTQKDIPDALTRDTYVTIAEASSGFQLKKLLYMMAYSKLGELIAGEDKKTE